jgi:stage II sporulation protein D
MSKYLWGLDEMLLSWPTETFKAQIVAARTFAARRGAGSDPVLSPTSADQNYTGVVHEDADTRAGRRWRNAVSATTGQVLVADGSNALIDALYTSSHGGRSEDKQFVWGGTAVSYLKAVDDSRWDRASGNPAGRRAWAVGLTWRQVAAALGVDSVTGMSVANRGSPGRNLGVRVTGVDSGVAFDRRYRGWDIRQALRAYGVKSPGYTIVR